MLSFWYSDSQYMTAYWNLLEAFYLHVIFIYSYVIVAVFVSAVFLLRGWCGGGRVSLISGFHSMSEFQLAPDQSRVMNWYKSSLVWKLCRCRFPVIFILTNCHFAILGNLVQVKRLVNSFFVNTYENIMWKCSRIVWMSGSALWKVL